MKPDSKETQSQENKQKQQRIKVDFAFCLSILLIFIILIIAFSQYKPKEQEVTENNKFAIPLPKTQIEQLDKPRQNLLPSFDLWILSRLNLLQEKLNFQGKESCVVDLNKAISLYSDNHKDMAFLKIFVSIEHLVKERLIEFCNDESLKYCKKVKMLWQHNLLTWSEAKILFDIARSRNLIVHVSGYTISSPEADVLLNKASFMISKLTDINLKT